MLNVCCRLKRCLTEVQTTNVDMVSEVAASSGRESHHLHCIQSLSAQTAKLQSENTELTGKVQRSFSCLAPKTANSVPVEIRLSVYAPYLHYLQMAPCDLDLPPVGCSTAGAVPRGPPPVKFLPHLWPPKKSSR